MRRIEVEAREDGSQRDSGQVIVFLEGLERLDGDAMFYLRPLDAVASGVELGVLSDEQRALAVRAVDGGVELVIAAELAQHPALAAGAPVEIEIPDAGVWSEFSWPALKVRARPAKVAASRAHTPLLTGRANGDKAFLAQRAAKGQPGETGGQAAAPAKASQTSRSIVTVPPAALEELPVSAAQLDEPPAGEEAHTQPGGPAPGHVLAQEYVVFYPYARGGKLGMGSTSAAPRERKSLLPTTRLGSALMAAVAVLAIQGAMWVGSGGHIASAPAATTATAGAPADGTIYDLFAAGPVSPRGVQARNVSTVKALENAQAALLTPGAPRDVEEGAYWLRRFLTSGGSDERTRRVLTQLGTAYADGTSRSPEYGKARQVWEMASAFGDPVAMCFLGTLHENGLGSPVDRRAAQEWYERARGAGGCPGVEESIARVKK